MEFVGMFVVQRTMLIIVGFWPCGVEVCRIFV